MPQDSARLLNKTLKMAAAAATEKQFSPDNLVVAEAFATVGPKIKRSRANSRGRSNRYIKHLAHITVMLAEKKDSIPTEKITPIAPKAKVETKVRIKR